MHAVKLVKVGAGTLILSGLNTYTNTTAVSNGTLVADGMKLACEPPDRVGSAGRRGRCQPGKDVRDDR